jgi:exopolysaccharide production protein ExoQ
MPPQLALFLCFGCIAFAYWVDSKREPGTSGGLWVPLIWVLIIGSRPVGLWLNPDSSGSYTDSSPLDAAIYSLLIGSALWILSRRQINWQAFIAENRILIFLFLYMFVSELWTDDPFVSFKRFIKMVGMPLMGLVVLTEQDPVKAIKTLTRRTAYVLIPLSYILDKYFFDLAVVFDQWTGAMMVSGVTESKNMFGQVCFITGLLMIWVLLTGNGKDERPEWKKMQLLIDGVVGFLSIYLLHKSNSDTSLICFAIGVMVMFIGNSRFVRWRIASLAAFGAIVFLILQAVFGVYQSMVTSIGRNPNLTNRTEIWQELWGLRSNLLIGTGFENFWTGERLQKIFQTKHINEAHNGYLEIILNLGLVGLSLYLLLIAAAYKNCRELIKNNYDFGRIAMTLWLATLVYNFTESGFKGLSFILFWFFLISMNCREVRGSVEETPHSFDYSFFSRSEN